MSNKIDDLRKHLFDTLADLRDKQKPMEIDRAKAIAEVATVIVETAKVEVAFIRETGAKGSGFLPEIEAPKGPTQPKLVKSGS